MHEVRNGILLKVDDADFAIIAPQLELVELKQNQNLLEPEAEISFVYFPESCICSVLAVTEHELPIEVGTFGQEGMSNFVVRAGDKSFLRTVVFLPGTAWRISAEKFEHAFRSLPSLSEVVVRYKEATSVQFAYTSWAHGTLSVPQRLARWLLMLQDRTGSEKVSITHDRLAEMLRVRRSGVTSSLHVLEGLGAIRATRGSILICDRVKLESMADGTYGPAEKAYRSLMSF